MTFARLESEIKKQREKASGYIENLKGIPGIRLITESQQTKATYPYLTLLFNDPAKCKKAKEVFKNAGLGIFQIYAMAITDYDYLKRIIENTECPNARSLAQNHITLTTSTFLKNEELNSIVGIIKNISAT